MWYCEVEVDMMIRGGMGNGNSLISWLLFYIFDVTREGAQQLAHTHYYSVHVHWLCIVGWASSILASSTPGGTPARKDRTLQNGSKSPSDWRWGAWAHHSQLAEAPGGMRQSIWQYILIDWLIDFLITQRSDMICVFDNHDGSNGSLAGSCAKLLAPLT